MRIGVLGTGDVGKSIASKLVELGHEVMLGSRTADNASAADWVASAGSGASQGTFADAGAHAELLFNCTSGMVSVEAIGSIPAEHLAGKTLVDVANKIDALSGIPRVVVSSTDSLGEELQRTFPDLRVVKALNTVNHLVMVDPARVPGEHDVFICGDDADAKAQAGSLLESFGWPRKRIVDLGEIAAARGMECYLVFWIRLRNVVGSGDLNVKLAR